MNVLRKLAFTFLICFLVNIVFSQQQYYIYIQSEDQQEFYVRTGSAVFNSSGNGYLVIPGLEKSTHEIIIGFPGKKEPEWRFNCTISEADLGFVLKAEGSNELQLLGLKQKDGMKGTVVEHHPQIKDNNVVAPPGVISNDPFSSMLAEVVNDPTIRQQLVIVGKETPPALAVTDDPSKALHASVPREQKPVDQENDKATTATPPLVTGALAEAGPDTATTAGEKPVPFVVKEMEKTNSVQSGKSSKAGAAEKAENTMAASTEKKYEPFVVREIHQPANTKAARSSASGTEKKEDSVATAPLKEPVTFVVKETEKDDISPTSSPKTGAEKDAVGNKETKYLPFVIKPGETKNSDEDKTANAETGKKDVAAETIYEKKDVPLVVKKDDKAVAVEKEKSGIPGPGKKDKDSTRVSMNEKQTPVNKKTILSSVRKTLERKSRDGTDLIYIDENINGAKDTIRIFIPVVQ
jgi:hypothetical protein